MITTLHKGGTAKWLQYYIGGGMPKWLQYYIGGGSLGTPKSDYVICARPLIKVKKLITFASKISWGKKCSSGLYARTMVHFGGYFVAPFTAVFGIKIMSERGLRDLQILECVPRLLVRLAERIQEIVFQQTKFLPHPITLKNITGASELKICIVILKISSSSHIENLSAL